MCLLIAVSRVLAEAPLMVGANRDESYERPARSMTVLRPARPRVLGGRDELAGGTWLAVSEAGVFAGVTNRPTENGRDPTKRSRGELPLLLTLSDSAAAAVDRFPSQVEPSGYNPAWILVGDRRSLFAIDLFAEGPPRVRELAPGVHVLENRPVGERSVKVDHVLSRMTWIETLSVAEVGQRLQDTLRDHETSARPTEASDEEILRSAATAACVHTDRYGTRWSGLVTIPGDEDLPPTFLYTDGPPCLSEYRDATPLWTSERGRP